jgi:hypothetical protein
VQSTSLYKRWKRKLLGIACRILVFSCNYLLLEPS